MHKSFYASGFLYSIKTHQILLLQNSSSYSLLGGESLEGEDAQSTFQRIISRVLNLNLKSKNIYPIYDYHHNTLDKTNYVFYAEVKKIPSVNQYKKVGLSWVSFSETVKLLFSEHTKQDVIVGERVINLKWRVDRNIR